MKRIVAVVVVLLILQQVDGKPVPKNIPKQQSDTDLLQGDWIRASAKRNGKELNSTSQLVLTLMADKWTVRSVNDDEDPTWISFKVDATKRPKEIDRILLNGTVLKGIYKLEGDVLTICHTNVAESRPTTFATDKGEILYVWKRQKK